MNVIDTVGYQIDYLIRGVRYTRLLHRLRVIAESVHQITETLGHIGTRHAYGIGHLCRPRDGHDTRDHGNRNALISYSVQEIIENIVIEEHLGC